MLSYTHRAVLKEAKIQGSYRRSNRGAVAGSPLHTAIPAHRSPGRQLPTAHRTHELGTALTHTLDTQVTPKNQTGSLEFIQKVFA